jgi:membrane protease YdiL (CAAX protease family)
MQSNPVGPLAPSLAQPFTAISLSGKLKPSAATWAGLLISLFGMFVLRWAFSWVFRDTTTTSAALKELCTWLTAAALLLLIRRGERLPLSSIGLGTVRWWKSLLWALAIAATALVAAGFVSHFTGYGQEPGSGPLGKLPLWLLFLIVVRAGVVEELFYRAYPIERLQSLGLARPLAAGIPLLIFAFGHANHGLLSAIIAFVVGGVLAVFYLWRRDLVANMVGHSLVDVIGVILPRIFA